MSLKENTLGELEKKRKMIGREEKYGQKGKEKIEKGGAGGVGVDRGTVYTLLIWSMKIQTPLLLYIPFEP